MTHRVKFTRLYIPLAMYLAAAFLSLTQSPDVLRGVVKIVGILSLMAALVVGLHVIDSANRWRRITDVWIASAVVASALTLLGVIAYYAGLRDPHWNIVLGNFGSLPPGRIPRMEGTFRNSNMFCNYLGTSACLLLARWHDLSERHGRMAVIAAFLVVAITIPFTLSPNLGAVAVSALVVILVARPVRAGWARATAALACVAMALGFMTVTWFMLVPKGQGDVHLGPMDLKLIGSGRSAAIVATTKTIAKHPLTGVGVGEPVAHFRHEYAAQGLQSYPKEHHLEAHNIYFGLLGQMGPLALIGFCLLLWWIVQILREMPARAAPEIWCRAALLAAVIGQLAYGGLFGGYEDSRHIWLLLALAVTAPLVVGVSESPGVSAARHPVADSLAAAAEVSR